jgi:tRNA pseudouridine13 synthase
MEMPKPFDSMDFAYLSKGSVSGRIKDKEEDFIVNEIDSKGRVVDENYVPEESPGKFTLFVMRKRNYGTDMAIKRIAKYIHTTYKRFGYAGMKDRKAITTQLISVFGIDKARIEGIKAQDMELLNPRASDKGLTLGDLKGNRFSLRIADRQGDAKDIEKQLKGYFPNYFGEQRFGNIRQCNHKIGYSILKGDYEQAVMIYLTDYSGEGDSMIVNARKELGETKDFKKAYSNFPKYRVHEMLMLNHLKDNPNDFINAIRTLPKFTMIMFVHALQSFIFNLEVSERIRQGALEPEENEYSYRIDEFGFANEEEKGNGKTAINLIGHNSELTEREKSILNSLGIEKEEFRNRSMPEMSCKGDKRAMLAPYVDFEEKEDWLSFKLGSGCYATSLLREFLKN